MAQGGEYESPPEGMGPWPHLLVLVGALLLNVVYTMARTAVAAIGPLAMEKIEEETSFFSRRLQRLLPTLPLLERRLRSSAAVMVLVAAMCATHLGSHLVYPSPYLGVALALLVLFLVHMVVVEGLSQYVALSGPTTMLRWVVPLAIVLSFPFMAVAWPFRLLTGERKTGSSPARLSAMHLRLLPTLRGIQRVIDEEAFEMIDSVREFADTTAEEIMTPRTEVEAIPDDLAPEEVYSRLRQAEYSRLVVYRGSIDHVRGTLLAKQVLLQKPADPYSLIRDPIIVSEKTRLLDLLSLIRQNRTHLAVVLDEYGGMAGIVTLHDLFEAIVGHIEDREDDEGALLEQIAEGAWRLNGRMEVWEVNEELDLDLDEDTARTIGGLVFNTLGRVAENGDTVSLNGLTIEVEETRDNRVETVVLRNNVPGTLEPTPKAEPS